MKDNTGQMNEMRLFYFQIRRTDCKMIKRGRKENQNVWHNGYLDETQYRTNEWYEINLFPN